MIDIDALEVLAKGAMRCQWGDSKDWADTCGDRGEGEYVAACEPDRMLALIAEVRTLREESVDWKRRWQEAVEHASALTVERNHWQANHDNQVSRARFLIERGDIPVERLRAYGLMGALLELESAIRHDQEMFAGTSDEFNPTGMLVTHALAAIDAARKEQT